MPFTLSHPAIVLPLRYLPARWTSLTGLVVGSIVPDFEYFIRMSSRSIYSHTWLGLFWFDLPLALLISFLFHGIVRNPLARNTPFLRRRLMAFDSFNWNRHFSSSGPVIVLSILVGAASHILWDGVTHQNDFFPILSEVTNRFGSSMAWFEVLQRASTIAGGLVVAVVLITLPRNEKPVLPIRYGFWLVAILITGVVLSVRVAATEGAIRLQFFVIIAVSALMVGLFCASLLYRRASY